MPRCKNCHQMLSSLDKDICPFCGTLKPLQGVSTETQDITKAIDPIQKDYVEIKYKSRRIAACLCAFLGVFGAHQFYLGRIKMGIIYFAVSLCMIGGAGSTLFFTNLIPNAFAFLLPYFVILALDIVLAFIYLFDRNIKDSHGEKLH